MYAIEIYTHTYWSCGISYLTHQQIKTLIFGLTVERASLPHLTGIPSRGLKSPRSWF